MLPIFYFFLIEFMATSPESIVANFSGQKETMALLPTFSYIKLPLSHELLSLSAEAACTSTHLFLSCTYTKCQKWWLQWKGQRRSAASCCWDKVIRQLKNPILAHTIILVLGFSLVQIEGYYKSSSS